MHRVNIVHLNGHVRVDVRLDVQLHHAQLHLRLIRPEEEDPVQPISTVQTDHVVVEGPALVESFREDVRLDPLHSHAGSVSRRLRVAFPNAGPGERWAFASAVSKCTPEDNLIGNVVGRTKAIR
jgi:hypothetical protein